MMPNRQSAKAMIDHFSESLREQKVSKQLIILSAVELHERFSFRSKNKSENKSVPLSGLLNCRRDDY